MDATREKPSRKQRLETDSELEVSEKRDDECTDVKRFRVVPKQDKLKWDLPESLDKYRNKHCNIFISEYHLQETFLVDNPVILT